MKHPAFVFIAATAMILTLTACSKAPHVANQQTVAGAAPPPAAAQQGDPPCGTMCKAGYIGLQLTGYGGGSANRNEFSAPLVIGTDKNGKALESDKGTKPPVSLTADWWTDGGTLRISASTGTPAMSWSPFGEKQHDMSPSDGVKVPAGWYYSYVTCSSSRCENVAVTINGKPVVPYAIPWHQP